MWTWLNYSDNGRMVKSWVVVFISTVLTLFMASGLDVFSISWTDAQAWIAAGIAAVAIDTVLKNLPNCDTIVV